MSAKELSDLRILAVDDDPFMLRILKATLNRIGVENVVTKETAPEALTYIQEADQPISAILCDLNMPEMSGIEFITELASSGYKGGIAVISGADEESIHLAQKAVDGKDIQILGALKKPVKAEDLGNLLAQVLS